MTCRRRARCWGPWECRATSLYRLTPPLAARIGQYRDGLLAITNFHLLLYQRSGLLFGYRPEVSFWPAEVRSITAVEARFAHPVSIVFADGSSCELDADTARSRHHLFEVLDALHTINAR